MPTDAIHPGDLILVNHAGRLFYAKVAGHERAGVLAVEPLERRLSHRTVKAGDIVEHWAHARRHADARPSRAQLRLEVPA